MTKEKSLFENDKIGVVEYNGEIKMYVKYGPNNDRRSYVASFDHYFLTVFKPSLSQPGFKKTRHSKTAQTIEAFFRLVDQ